MATPILQFKRGTAAPGSIFYAAEPAYDTTGKVLYVGNAGGAGAGAGTAVASASTYASSSEILVKSVASTSAGQVLLKDAQATQNTVTLTVPATVTTSYSFTLPAAVPAAATGYFLTSNTSGTSSWSQVDILAVTGLGTGVATFLATPSSANLISAVTDETGSGSLVFATSPSLTTPALAGETFSTTNNVTAGTNAQGQGALTTDINVIATAAAAPSGVTLPTATQGRRIVIVNKGANAVNVYPATGATIDALAINTGISLPVNGLLEFNASSTTQWYSSFQSTVTGTGVTSFSAGTTGLTPSSGTTGTVTLAGTLAVANGGTGTGTAGIAAFNNITGYTASGATGTTSTNLVFSTSPTITGGTINALATFSLRDTSAAFNVTLAATSSTALSAGRTVTLDVVNAARTVKLAGNLDFAGNFTTSGAFATTLTTTAATNVTLPTSGTLATTGNLSQFASTTSAQLAGVISDETGFTTGALAVFNTSPSFVTSVTTSSVSFDVFNATATTINAFNAATTAAIANAATAFSMGNTATAAQTVNMFTASIGASTYNFATGATATATAKAINIGTGGAAGSTTTVTIGSNTSGSVTAVSGNLTIGGNLTVSGTTTTINTTNTVVSDALIELANGSTGAQAVTRDAGIVIERGDDTNVFFGYDEGVDVFVAGTTTATGSTNGDVAPTPIVFLAGAFNVTDTAGTNQAVVSYLAASGLFNGSAAGRYLQNVTVDCGTY